MLLNCGVGEDSWSPLESKEIQPVHPKGNQSWVLIWRTDAEAETPILWPPIRRADSLERPWSGKDWSDQIRSVAQLCPTLCYPMNCSTPGFPVHYQLPEFTQTHVHWVSDAIQPSHPLPSPSSPAFNLSHHQGLFQWVSSSHQVAKVLELQLQFQHQSLQWIFRIDFL